MTSHHLIVGGQRSGKSRHAERLAQAWMQRSATHSVTVVVTALASDEEMHARIVRHRLDRPLNFELVEAPLDLGAVVRVLAVPQRLVVIDCLTMWLTNVLMPVDAAHASGVTSARYLNEWTQRKQALLDALRECTGPVVLVSNEIGMGVIPLGADVRQVVDELGRLHQDVAQCCEHITLMAAGQPFTQQVQRWR